LRRAILGRDRVAEPLARARAERPPEQTADKPVPLQVDVVHDRVTRFETPLVVVGMYKGVPPARGAADVDEALGGSIRYAQERGMFRAELGEVFLVPTQTNPAADRGLAPRFVMLAGLGQPGEFGRDDLRYLMVNVTHAAILLRFTEFATVLLGAGRGNLSIQQSLRGILEGACDALSRTPLPRNVVGAAGALQRVTFVEPEFEHAKEAYNALEEVRSQYAIPNLVLGVGKEPERNPAAARASARASAAAGRIEFPDREAGVRITIERRADVFTFSALTDTAVIPVREVPVQEFLFTGVADKLMTSITRGDQENYGQLLNTYLVPEDFQKLLEPGKPLTLVLDRSTAAFPWEMAAVKSPGGLSFFGPGMRLARQFRTLLSTAPPLPTDDDQRLRVLVIADPAPEPHLQLPGARREGREVVRMLHAMRGNEVAKKRGVNMEVVDRIGPSDCDPVEVLSLILGEQWDVIHFAGHGFFDAEQPDRGGWVFGKDKTLSAREIFRTRRVPQLVFANACYSAVVNGDVRAEAMNRRLAGLVEAFFDRGVANYIGTGWPVSDTAAVPFARTFYWNLMSGQNLGVSLAAARETIIGMGPTWGAYQHYGQSGACFTPKWKGQVPPLDDADDGDDGEAGNDGRAATRGKGRKGNAAAGRRNAAAAAAAPAAAGPRPRKGKTPRGGGTRKTPSRTARASAVGPIKGGTGNGGKRK
jgi:hypothetical protein